MKDAARKGTALVICAPSGAGKTTLTRRLLSACPQISFSVSYTTRAPRAGERSGRDYFFVSPERFTALVQEGFFAEWAQVHGHYYGTPLRAAADVLEQGGDLLFDVDVQGARQLKERLDGVYLVFVFPPSRVVLEERLRARRADTDAAISLRLSNALPELRQADWFDAWIVNDDQERASEELRAVYRAACLRPGRRPEFLRSLLDEFCKG